MSRTVEEVIRCIARTLEAEGRATENLDGRSLLFDEKILDSFGVISLLQELESTFRVSLSTEDLVIQNFETPERIARLIDAQRRS